MRMSDLPRRNESDSPERPAPPGASSDDGPTGPGRRNRGGKRVILLSLISVLLLGGLAAGGYMIRGNSASATRRAPATVSDLRRQPAANAHRGRAMTVLITGEDTAISGWRRSGLVMLLHVNAGHAVGGVVSIPPNAVVPVPGHGREQLWDALVAGGPRLLVRTIEQLTNVTIENYARIDFAHVSRVVDAVGGVNVRLPKRATSFGHTFFAGVNYLGGAAALAYVRQPSLTQEERVLRQQALIRAVMRKLGKEHLRTNPVTMFRALSALTQMLTVDSDFSNSRLESLADQLRSLGSKARTFVTAPTYVSGGRVFLKTARSDRLWRAVRHGTIAAFAARFPATVTGEAPR
ncbi:MAG TPA: LCP family protein [Streptosporangiaceae bacterium]